MRNLKSTFSLYVRLMRLIFTTNGLHTIVALRIERLYENDERASMWHDLQQHPLSKWYLPYTSLSAEHLFTAAHSHRQMPLLLWLLSRFDTMIGQPTTNTKGITRLNVVKARCVWQLKLPPLIVLLPCHITLRINRDVGAVRFPKLCLTACVAHHSPVVCMSACRMHVFLLLGNKRVLVKNLSDWRRMGACACL